MENENQKDPGGQTTNSGGNVENEKAGQTNGKTGSVDYDSYVKALDEKKRAQAKLADILKENENYRESDLKRKGKTDELLTEKDKRIAELEARLEDTGKTYTWKTITDTIKSKAKDSGCTQPDKLIRLMGDDDLKKLSENIGDNFEVDGNTLDEIIEKNKKENFFLFQENKKVSANGNPKFNAPDSDGLDLEKMSLDELKEMHRKVAQQ